jgi:uncharacterized protein DUF4177
MSLTACAVLTLAAFIPVQPPTAQPQRAKWEYKEVDFDSNSFGRAFDEEHRKTTVEAMNKLGDEGWECVSIADAEFRSGAMWAGPGRAYYKRSKDATTRKKWEYSVVDVHFANPSGFALLPPSDAEQLKKFDEEGWELASTVRRERGTGWGGGMGRTTFEGQYKYIYLLKRPK